MSVQEIEQLAEAVRALRGLFYLPLDPLALARSEGIYLAPGCYDGCFDGRLELRRKNGRSRFYLFYAQEDSPRRPPSRVRFSIAHELAHFYLPEHRRYLLSGYWQGRRCQLLSDRRLEREADLFAAALLMPRRRFLEEVSLRQEYPWRLQELTRLADRVFYTSLTSTAIRYAQLDCQPCCVVLSEGGHVRFSIPSARLRSHGIDGIRRGAPVPADSVTGHLLAAPLRRGCRQGEGAVSGDVWFAGSQPLSLWEEAKILGRTGRVLTLLVLNE